MSRAVPLYGVLQYENYYLFSLFHPFKGGLFFAKPMRDNNYISMMDPFRRKYGKPLTVVLAIVPVISDIVWIPALFISLGTNTQVNSCEHSISDLLAHFLNHTFSSYWTVYVWLWSRSDHECGFGSALQCLHLDLCCSGHRLHCSWRSLFSRFHWCHPDITDAS